MNHKCQDYRAADVALSLPMRGYERLQAHNGRDALVVISPHEGL